MAARSLSLLLLPLLLLPAWLSGCDGEAGIRRGSDAPPVVTLHWPVQPERFLQGHELSFVAAVDGRAGDGLEILWASDIDGTLHTEQTGEQPRTTFPFSTGSLTVGSHVITVTVSDAEALSGADSIELEVIADLPPEVSLELPVVETWTRGIPLDLRGEVSDDHLSSGDLQVTWSSDLDGVLFEGRASPAGTTTLVTSDLSAGAHVLTLSAADRLGQADEASVAITLEVAELENCLDDDGDGLVDEGFDADADGVVNCLDEEVCNGQDDDGDGLVDEESPDTDGDGLCDGIDVETCDGLDNDGDGSVDEDFTDLDGDGIADCMDVEVCDGMDNDGDGGVDEDDPDTDSDGVADCMETEECDGLDNDGNGQIDELFDGDGDGHLDDAACGALGSDCDDAEPTTFDGAPETCDGVDQDCDGAVDEDFDLDLDGHLDLALCAAIGGDDCDDGDPSAFPGAPEQCDAVDDDCDGAVDEGFDVDGDGYLDVTYCSAIGGDDCDDSSATIHPGAVEDCNGFDDDCDTAVDEDFDADGDGHLDDVSCAALGADCDDSDPAIYDGAPELCDGDDNNCDGVADETFDEDGDGFLSALTCPTGDDCDDLDSSVWPGAPEVCNGSDDDCDGADDEDFDVDGDGHLDATLCPLGDDCDDSEPLANPDAIEACDGIDNDCDGYVDEGYPDADGAGGVDCLDDDGDGWTEELGDCDDEEPLANPGQIELQDGIDNDCDGEIDEDYCLVPVDQTSIQACIDEVSDGMTVLVMAGTYVEQIDYLSKDITVESVAGPAVTIIDGAGVGPVVTIASGELEAVLEGFTITGGVAVDGGGLLVTGSQADLLDLVVVGNEASVLGGGAYLSDGRWTVEGCLFEDNVGNVGGAIFKDGTGDLDLFDSVFQSNESIHVRGGAVKVHGGVLTVSNSQFLSNTSHALRAEAASTVIADSLFQDNTSWAGGAGIYAAGALFSIQDSMVINNWTDDCGAGIEVSYSSAASLIQNTLIEGNTAGSGAGVCSTSTTPLLIVDSVIQDNTASDLGGGVLIRPIPLTIIDSTIIDNTASDLGGGIAVHDPSSYATPATLQVIGSDISANQGGLGGAIGSETGTIVLDVFQTTMMDNVGVTQGGAVWLLDTGGEIKNSVIAGNTTYGHGGGLYLESTDVSLNNLVVADNTAYGQGGGLFIEGDPAAPMSLVGSIVTGNTGVYGICEAGGSSPTLAWNDAWDNFVADYGGTLTDLTGIDGNISADPLFVDPAGGDYTLQVGSPCVDFGDPDPANNDTDGTRNDMGARGGPFGGW